MLSLKLINKYDNRNSKIQKYLVIIRLFPKRTWFNYFYDTMYPECI